MLTFETRQAYIELYHEIRKGKCCCWFISVTIPEGMEFRENSGLFMAAEQRWEVKYSMHACSRWLLFYAMQCTWQEFCHQSFWVCCSLLMEALKIPRFTSQLKANFIKGGSTFSIFQNGDSKNPDLSTLWTMIFKFSLIAPARMNKCRIRINLKWQDVKARITHYYATKSDSV